MNDNRIKRAYNMQIKWSTCANRKITFTEKKENTKMIMAKKKDHPFSKKWGKKGKKNLLSSQGFVLL